ncbi:hypothetical protein AB0395_04330 [Streptosporangium sp. NPDC051023]|uniref:hypothetical protein n=1 Tax=Streptosporangium sp. NPDC051023 TaxID=3155410 RepID=UPI00344BB52B
MKQQAPTGRQSRRRIAAAVLAACSALAVIATPGAADASQVSGSASLLANQDGICTSEICFAAASIGNQSISDFAVDDPNLNDNVYISPGLNRGLRVGNSAKWVWNGNPSRYAIICTDINYRGNCASVAPNSGGPLSFTYANDVESVRWE